MDKKEYDKGYNDCIAAIKQALSQQNSPSSNSNKPAKSDLPPLPIPQNPQQDKKEDPLNPSKELLDKLEQERQKAIRASQSEQISDEKKKELQDYIDSLDDLKEKAEAQAKLAKGDVDSLETDIRLKRIRKEFNNIKNSEENPLIGEVKIARAAERQFKRAEDAQKYKNSPLYKFKANLTNFIKRETALKKETSRKKPKASYTALGFYAPGKKWQDKPNETPVIFVYYDQSRSFNEEDIKVGNDAMKVLNDFVRKGQIEIVSFYFATKVYENADDARADGGTRGSPILTHIKTYKPDNVIVLTDNDIADCVEHITVPGAVWFLWRNSKSTNLLSHLHGKKETTEYFLEDNKHSY